MRTLPERNRGAALKSIQMLVSQQDKAFDIRPGSGLSNQIAILAFSQTHEYVIVIEHIESRPSSFIQLFRRDVASKQLYGFKFAASDFILQNKPSAKQRPIPMIIDAIDKLCPTQLDMFGDADLAPEFERVLKIATSGGAGFSNLMIDLSSLNRPSNDQTFVDIFYKSENTTLNHQSHKIVMFTVSNGSNRDDAYAACYPRVDQDNHFRSLMGHHRNNRHGFFMKTLSDHLKAGKCQYHRVDQDMRNSAVFCLTSPKSEEGIQDPNFKPMHSYRLIGIENSIDGFDYLSLIDDQGNQVSRRANHFVRVPFMKQNVKRAA